MITHSTRRVPAHTAPAVQARIERCIACNVHYFAQHPEEIDERLRELDAEWDIERTVEAKSSALSLIGLVLGLFGRKRWLLLPLGVQAFMLQHALTGWCPPLAILRRFGVRTRDEIARERYALKALRGDFKAIDDSGAEPTALALHALSATE